MKNFIFDLNNLLQTFPKNERILTDNIKQESFKCLELIFYSNNISNRKATQKEIISKISMLDFYLEYAYKMKYISQKQATKKSHELNAITKMF
jgi:hypothetical protein